MCMGCDWETSLGHARQAIEDAEEIPERGAEFAMSVTGKLESIAAWIERNEHVTQKQKDAIEGMWEGIQRWRRD